MGRKSAGAQKECVCAQNQLVRTCPSIYLYEKFLVLHCYLMTLDFKFHKDRTISCGDTLLFVTLYNFENEKKDI